MILIDLDGTLVDSVPDLAFCVDGMMQQLGKQPHGEAAVRTWVGNGVERLVKRALLGQLEGEPDAALFARALPLFLALYQDNTSQRSRLYPGVLEGLAMLREAGFKLGCVTNKAERFTTQLLHDKGIADHFSLVVSGDTLPRSKPDPGPLFYAAGWFRLKPQEALMVGDSRTDVQAARSAGFQIVCVSYGYNHGEDIRLQQPDAVIDRLDELPRLFT